jgi:hypothetical protein
MSVWEKLESVEYEDLPLRDTVKVVKDAIEAGKPVKLVLKFTRLTLVGLSYDFLRRRWQVFAYRYEFGTGRTSSVEATLAVEPSRVYGSGLYFKGAAVRSLSIYAEGKEIHVIIESPGVIAFIGIR